MPANRIHINRLDMINYKKFIKAAVSFEPSITVISGKNGAGKSTILSGVRLILSWIIARMRNESGVGYYISPSDINNATRSGCVVGSMLDGEVFIPSKAKAGLSKDFALDLGPVKPFVSAVRNELAENASTCCVPVFAYYGVKRTVLDIPLRTRSRDFTLFDTYDKSLDGAANFRGFFTWFRACEDWENQQIVRTNRPVQHPGLQAFRRAIEQFMPGYSGFMIERHPLAMMLRKNGEPLNAEQLSDGEKIYLALVGDLCHRLSLANQVGDPLLGGGIVLIDEVDLHLHPQWQSEIANALTRTFPNIQFIISTHSPHVINSVPTTSLRIIDADGSITSAPYGYGMPSNVVLGDLMSLSRDVPEEVDNAIRQFNVAYLQGNINDASNQLTILQESVPDHPELPRMRMRLERMRR